MKKTKLIALTMVVAIMMMGAGYALWQDTLVLNETIEMGNVEVQWFWNGVKPDPKGVFVATSPTVAGNSNRSADKHTYTVKVENVYPGAEVRWDGSLINKGSLPVKFDNVDLVMKTGTAFVEHIDVHYDTRYLDEGGSGWGAYNHHNTTFAELENEMNSDAIFKGYVLDTEDRIQFGDEDEPNCIILKFHDDMPQSLENQTLEFDLVFTFVQAYN